MLKIASKDTRRVKIDKKPRDGLAFMLQTALSLSHENGDVLVPRTVSGAFDRVNRLRRGRELVYNEADAATTQSLKVRASNDAPESIAPRSRGVDHPHAMVR